MLPEANEAASSKEFEIEAIDMAAVEVDASVDDALAPSGNDETAEIPVVSDVAFEDDDDDLIDDEIIEIFLEEAEEVRETLNEFWPQFKANTTDQDALTTSRRAFHTLKGSGRMVNAE